MANRHVVVVDGVRNVCGVLWARYAKRSALICASVVTSFLLWFFLSGQRVAISCLELGNSQKGVERRSTSITNDYDARSLGSLEALRRDLPFSSMLYPAARCILSSHVSSDQFVFAELEYFRFSLWTRLDTPDASTAETACRLNAVASPASECTAKRKARPSNSLFSLFFSARTTASASWPEQATSCRAEFGPKPLCRFISRSAALFMILKCPVCGPINTGKPA
jgi:hypothetical protein